MSSDAQLAVLQQQWTEVDDYLKQTLLPQSSHLEQTLEHMSDQGLPAINVSALQGQFLMMMVQISGARRILEIGTLGGYSAQYMAKGLPDDGILFTLEKDPHVAEVAQHNIESAQLADKIKIIVGEASETLQTLSSEAPFDLIFIDADKQSSSLYLDWAVKLGRQGSIIIMDNAIREGAIIHEQRSEAVEGVRQALDRMSNYPELTVTALQTVGEKGWDGFALLRINTDREISR
ncbi:O-methyltransferase [Xenorhabdus griffiniae]|uniref:O-methyltransferase n=1 Tax=Xenorhabdus griffiniae TaxID=351672 RepID=A0ABY9XJX8_9GAMM|nr:O-methyltransferase [Xenorhabdus griffiniae]MBD1226596.1 O-methyltransferase [Xenorhabdus griffiniae]MBE8587522.1 O-methyltransferase [Xenorhabdus griffiniae]WMV73237.1 O-methyltransferase [Xenorhabdus griffiniae]WNH02916.1 O-methyltransferase [Xenorhabdus griffiniae]